MSQTVSSIPEKMDSKFRFVLVSAQRAEQLMRGARTHVDATGLKSTRVAQEEVRRGMVSWEYGSVANAALAAELGLLKEEPEAAEDEVEAATEAEEAEAVASSEDAEAVEATEDAEAADEAPEAEGEAAEAVH